MVAELELAAADRWYVTNGATAVGPVNLDLLTRGIQSGKVPLESFVRHEGWKVWRPLTDIAEVTATPLPAPTVRASIPPPPVSTDDITLPGRPALPEDGLAADAIAGAADLREALLLLMAAVVQTLGAEGAIIHRLDDDGATAVCAHGPRMFEVLGQRTRLLDPVIVAAAGGHTVLAEPTPGPAGDALLTRMTSLGLVTVDGAFMMPIRGSSRLLAMLEVGRKRRFRATELAAAEELIDALVENADANGW
jgi:hypothetical protein